MAARVHELMSSSKEPEGAWQQESPASSRAETPDNQEQQRSLPGSSSPTRRTSVAINAPTPTPTRPPPLHRLSTSPMMHTSHAKILQLQEYRERVQSACHSTYQFSLQAPRKPSPDDKRRRARKGHCRSHVLASTKQFFPAREPAPSHFSAPVGHGKDRVLPRTSGAHVNFHQMTARRDEFLFGDRTGSTSRRPRVAHDGDRVMGIAKDHFALGPGQYDVAIVRPKTAAAAIKFSPSDRFHDTFSTAQLGPGQYITSDELTTPRAAAAVFSQTPRQTEAALLVSPTANTVSSYYYAPASSFPDKSDRPSCWPRSPRLSSQRRTTASLEAQKHRAESSATDFVERNRTAVEAQSTVQRMRAARVVQGRLEPGRRRGLDSDDDDDGDAADSRPPATHFKRRSSIFYDADTAAPQSKQQQRQADIAAASTSQPLVRRPSGGSNAVSKQPIHQLESDRAVRGFLTLATLSAFSVRLTRTYHLASLVRRIESTERQHVQRVVFSAWRTLDRAHSLQFATRMILANSFQYRLQLRIRRKCAHVKILRQFLGGLSIDVQFAVAMKKIKRKVQLIQRWWRHVQLMVKAREEALYHKWVNVETRLRLEHVGQMPHLQRIFQQPTTSSSGDTALHKLLNLPEQSKWFAAHFVLTSDGCLRGYSGAGGSKELVVEAKNFRCTFHEGVADALRVADGAELSRASTLSLQPHTGYSNARWKPFVMVFRPGAFRFVLLASPSPMPTEILAWKDKLERLAMAPATGGSISGSSSGGGAEGYHLRPTVGDFVEVSMQSGVLAATTNSSTHSVSALATVGEGGSSASPARNVAAVPRGKVQARVRSIRQRTRAGVAVSEGALTYYVVDLLRDFPKVPPALVYQTIRETLREKRKSFRAAIYRYNLELFHFHRHQEQTQRLCVLDKFKEFFVRRCPPGWLSRSCVEGADLVCWRADPRATEAPALPQPRVEPQDGAPHPAGASQQPHTLTHTHTLTYPLVSSSLILLLVNASSSVFRAIDCRATQGRHAVQP